MSKTNAGNFFEDFQIGQVIKHATPRTITSGDQALYTALYGSRFAVQSSDAFARALGYAHAPVDDLLTFHVVFGKTVPDISLNAVANLGYSGGRFLAPVYPGDTLSTVSEVIGKKENSNGKTGVVYVRSTGYSDDGTEVLDYVRWVMVKKRDVASPHADAVVPDLPAAIDPQALGNAVPLLDTVHWENDLCGSPFRWADYETGEKIDHVDGMTVEEAEHQMATRLYQNTAKVHFNLHTESESRFGKRLIYGGHVISLARALSFNGLSNAFHVAGINGGRHVAPLFAGDTVYAWSEVLEKAEIDGRSDVAALRLRLVATKNRACADFPLKDADGKYEDGVILDFDYWALMPK
ncbi:MaoC family dehydratase [Roseibium alexandrii]|uniref:Bifunctional aldehyde dehydrogenase/enoyl-CoA hydratase n=1 Tax=Roseibium alexandrii TaxID=388408 RepID=A0A0M7A7Z5_9HYPH|nr:MaoC family dehydratase [Roseibium alexandrii]CTQ69853.1 bifunctional aldehyde dehydrogenase/enoyl-CoA hydratase [Roseibium alexandrii]